MRCPHDGAVFVDEALVAETPIGGRFRLIEPLARGAFAEVSVAADGRADRSLGRLVAVKRLLPNLRQDTDALTRFEREGELLDRLRDAPGVVRLVERGRTEAGDPFLALEYLDGRTLEEVLSSYGRLPVDAAIRVALALLRALDGVHRAGLVHRDLKPSNIMMLAIEETARLRLLDFGIARDPGRSDERLTAPNRTLGTPSYMSPEQWGSATVDERSDLYSTGVIFYQMLTGRLPFEGDADQVAHQHRSVTPPRVPSELNVPESIVAVLDRALCKLPELRHQTARDFYDALAHAVGLPDSIGTPPTLRSRPASDVPSEPAPRLLGALPRATARLGPPAPVAATVAPATGSGRVAAGVPRPAPLISRRAAVRAAVAATACLVLGLLGIAGLEPASADPRVEVSAAQPIAPMSSADEAPPPGRTNTPTRIELAHGVDEPALLALPKARPDSTRRSVCPPGKRLVTVVERHPFTNDVIGTRKVCR